jgi:hypothetical protein
MIDPAFWLIYQCTRGDAVNSCFQCTAYFGVSTNLVNYLKDRLHQDSKAAANSVTNWQGTSSIMALVAAFLADAFLGRYWTIAIFMLISVVVRISLATSYTPDVVVHRRSLLTLPRRALFCEIHASPRPTPC